MTISKYFKDLFKNFFVACGFLMTIVTIVMSIHFTEIIKVSLIWQIILVAFAYAFLKLAFVNEDELGKKVQMLFFIINLSLAEVIVMIWLLFFSPGRIMNINLIMVYIFSLIIVKGLVYKMMYINSEKHAKLINEKLIEYKSGEK